jgi:hypothetical protein
MFPYYFLGIYMRILEVLFRQQLRFNIETANAKCVDHFSIRFTVDNSSERKKKTALSVQSSSESLLWLA